ncbi:MAG: hypothetical protein NVSMB48_21590 [Marmoricola sp.]
MEMVMPRRHILWYLATDESAYGRNLIEMGRLLHRAEGCLRMLDIGANIGDTALTTLAEAPGECVCVEPDPQWLTYLYANVEGHPAIRVEPSAIVPGAAGEHFSIVHADVGSSRLEASIAPATDSPPVITTGDLLDRHPQLKDVRLIKTDTDGYDVLLAPALAETFAASRPIIFLEFEPVSTGLATPDLPMESVWKKLLDLGYEQAVVWTNGGHLIGAASVESLIERTPGFVADPQRGDGFWDVAVAHRDDPIGLGVLLAIS